MRKAIYIILILLLFGCNSQSKETEKTSEIEFHKIENQEIIDLKNKIADFNEVQSSHIGAAGSPSPQYQNFEKLIKIATEKDLILLSKDTNNVVRTYATFGLIEKNSNEVEEIFNKSLKTQHKVITMKGCSVGEDLISSEIYHYYWNKVRLDSENEFIALQKDKTLLKLDSLILINKNVHWLLYNRVFSNRIFPKSYDSLIENIALKERNIDGIEYLFKNNLQQNKEQITNVLLDYLNDDTISPMYNKKIFKILLSFKLEKFNNLVLEKIKTEKRPKSYNSILEKYNLIK